MHTLYHLAHFFRRHQLHRHMNPANDEYSFVSFYFARYVSRQAAVARINLTRLQRASEGAHHSTGRRGDRVVQRGCVRLLNESRINFVVFADPAFIKYDPNSTAVTMQPNARDLTYSVYRPDLAALGAKDGFLIFGSGKVAVDVALKRVLPANKQYGPILWLSHL